MDLFNSTSFMCSKIITNNYSTSFSLGIKTLNQKFHEPIYGIYGFVRYADEIVDTFHDKNKKDLLESFRSETHKAISTGISMNPVLHSFQLVVNRYKIHTEMIDAFLSSMEMDLYQNSHKQDSYDKYIYGSAEVVGLMCLKVFSEGDDKIYNDLMPYAKSLGSAFQKVNFLRDIKSDYLERGRIYFPGIDFQNFSSNQKTKIEEEIKKDFEEAIIGIRKLPNGAKAGVYLAYVYYLALFEKIKKLPAAKILSERIRITDDIKLALLLKSYFKNSFRTI